MSELKAPLQDSLSVKDLSTLVTNPVWVQWFNNILRYTIPALGSANQKLFVNSAGVESEWASGLKVGSFTRAMDAATGDVAYTGVGFKPSHIIFLTMLTDKSWSIGFDSSAAKYVIFMIGTTNYSSASTASIYLIEDGTSKHQTAIVKTLGADGFTLTWTRTGATASATGYIYYMAFR